MELLNWNESYFTNIPIIDGQHKVLFNKIAQLHDCIYKKSSSYDLGILLDELLEYTNYHFETEEEFFNKYNYSEKSCHINEHEIFINYLNKILVNKVSDETVAIELLNFLNKWISHHIMDVDMKYVEFLKEKINNNL